MGVIMNLFLERIANYIPDEMNEFMESLNRKMYQGLRINLKKINQDDFESRFSLIDKPSLFCKEGYYVSRNLGNHPYHICGLYYLQEPSAMGVVEALDVQPDDIVLDLCAAPGGKSTQIASKLKDGFLISNEIDKKRCQILLSNMERMGIMNMAITNSSVDKIAVEFPNCFDKVVVDAPCSGEGMMKKHNLAKEEWSVENIEYCAARQKEILNEAYKVLKKDGILVYSTCTYAKEENEDVIAWFLKEHEDLELMDINLSFGRSGLSMEEFDSTKVRRIFPMDKGEGHFIAKIRKTQGSSNSLPTIKNNKIDDISKKFLKDQLYELYPYYNVIDGSLYCMNREFVKFKKVKCIRQGLYCGDLIKNRFEPSHAFYMTYDFKNLKHKVDVTFDQMNVFMHGNVIQCPCDRGYTAVCYDGFPFGFGKSDGNVIKNKIPKGLRLMEGSSLYGKE